MRIVSPLLEGLSSGIARRIDDLSSTPSFVRQASRIGHELPGHEADPIVIVPGLTADAWMYRRGTEMLREEGFDVTAMHMPWHGWNGIPGDAKQLRETVERAIDRAQKSGRDIDRVQLVGDSEGGLISRQFLQFEGGNQLVSRLITNGTPHNGIRPFASDAVAAGVQRLRAMPAGVRDLLTSSPVMHRLNGDWSDFLVRARAADPAFTAHSIASRVFGANTDGLVPVAAARLAGDAPVVNNYLTTGAHSINFAFGKRQTEAGHVLLGVLGSGDTHAQASMERARAAAAQAAAGVGELR